MSIPGAPNEITKPFASSDSFKTSVFMLLKVSKQELVISDWEDSERLCESAVGLALLCAASSLFCCRKVVERLGFSAVGGFMGDCEGLGTKVTFGREFGESALVADDSRDSLLAEFSLVSLELDSSLEPALTDPLLSLRLGDCLTISSSSPCSS